MMFVHAGYPFVSETPIRIVVAGLDWGSHSIEGVSTVREEKPGPPIGPLAPSWRERLGVTVSRGHGWPRRGRGTN